MIDSGVAVEPQLTLEEQEFCRRCAAQPGDPMAAFLASFADAALIPERYLPTIIRALLSHQGPAL